MKNIKTPTPENVEQENNKLRHLQFVVDLTTITIQTSTLSVPEMIELVHQTKRIALKLFPEKLDVYNLIYKPRFERLINERINLN